jgi:hypothetical protein
MEKQITFQSFSAPVSNTKKAAPIETPVPEMATIGN